MYLKQLGLLFLIVIAVECQKLQVRVFYESLCPDSAQFINKQLTPASKDLLQYMDLRLVPYGKSTYVTQGADVIFTCHHGPNECYGNKVHACAIENIQTNSYRQDYTRESLILNYVDCLMALGRDPTYPIERCANEMEYKAWEVIRDCANSTTGSKILQRYGDETMNFQNPLASVPTIEFKSQYDSGLQKRSLDDFRGTFCDLLHKENIHAKECHNPNAGTLPIISAITLLLTAALAMLFM